MSHSGSISSVGKSWDRRLQLDGFFWMTQYAATEDAFWHTGQRDWGMLVDGLPADWLRSARAVEIGCGVGRILRAATVAVSSVTGFDISGECIQIAKTHFDETPNIDFVLGDGIDLSGLVGTYDLVYSFATFPHLSPETLIQYLLDIRACTHLESIVRLQLYIGEEVLFCRDDTFSLRCYRQENFVDACKLVGFDVDWIRRIQLPFEADDSDRGRIPMIAALRPTLFRLFPRGEVVSMLCIGREPDGVGEGSLDEYRYLITYANELIRRNDFEAAERFIEFAIQSYKNVDLGTRQALERIRVLRR